MTSTGVIAIAPPLDSVITAHTTRFDTASQAWFSTNDDGLIAASHRARPGGALDGDTGRKHAGEIAGGDQHHEQDRHDQGELDQRLSTRAGMAIVALGRR